MTSLVRQIYAMIFFAAFVAAGHAQQVGEMVQSDLNGDGRVERFTLLDTGNGTVDLQIENTGGGVIYAENIVWLGGMGGQPNLEVAANGSLRVLSGNDAVGRNRWNQVLTVAYRNNAYRVAGFTYSWYDTLNLEDNGTCDLNLLSGRGYLTKNEVTQDVRTEFAPLPVTQWNDELPFPDECGLNGY